MRIAPKEWTVLCYNPAETNTGQSALAQTQQLERVGADENTDIVTLNYKSPWVLDIVNRARPQDQGTQIYALPERPQGQEPRLPLLPGEWQSAAEFVTAAPHKLATSPSPSVITSEQNPADPKVLKQFLLESMKRYPAKHFALVMGGHGGGLAGQSVIAGQRIRNEELAGVLKEVAQEAGQKIDLVNLNTCYGANLEVLHPLRNATDVVVGSQGTIAMANQPVAAVVKTLQQSLKQGQEVTPQQLGKLFVEHSRYQDLSNFHTPTLSAIDMAKVGAVSDAVAALHQRILADRVDPGTICKALESSARLDYSAVPRPVYVFDLGSFAHKLAQQVPALESEALKLRAAVQDSVLAEQHQEPGKETWATRLLRLPFQYKFENNDGLTGISMHYDLESQPSGSRLPLLKDTELGKATHIEEFFAHLSSVYHQQQAELPEWKKQLKEVSQKVAVFENKLNKKVGIPYVVPAAKWALQMGLTVGASMALSALGVPVAQAIVGPVLIGSALKGIWDQTQVMLSDAPKEERIDAAGGVAMGACLGTFGLTMMGLASEALAWPLAGLAVAARLTRFVAKHFASAGERAHFEADKARFDAAATAHQKLATV